MWISGSQHRWSVRSLGVLWFDYKYNGRSRNPCIKVRFTCTLYNHIRWNNNAIGMLWSRRTVMLRHVSQVMKIVKFTHENRQFNSTLAAARKPRRAAPSDIGWGTSRKRQLTNWLISWHLMDSVRKAENWGTSSAMCEQRCRPCVYAYQYAQTPDYMNTITRATGTVPGTWYIVLVDRTLASCALIPHVCETVCNENYSF